MLYYIVPPIIMIVCVAALIFFLFRKTESIPLNEFSEDGFENRRQKKVVHAVVSSTGQFSLKVLERVMHRSKLLSLKFHNTSNEWFHSIREKRQRNMQQIQEGNVESVTEKEPVSEIVEVQEKPTQERIRQALRPMVRDTVTRPQKRNRPGTGLKDQLEDVLIKRIAMNPRDIEAYERLGDYYMESANHRDALECFRQVLKLSPTHYKAKLRIRKIERMK